MMMSSMSYATPVPALVGMIWFVEYYLVDWIAASDAGRLQIVCKELQCLFNGQPPYRLRYRCVLLGAVYAAAPHEAHAERAGAIQDCLNKLDYLDFDDILDYRVLKDLRDLCDNERKQYNQLMRAIPAADTRSRDDILSITKHQSFISLLRAAETRTVELRKRKFRFYNPVSLAAALAAGVSPNVEAGNSPLQLWAGKGEMAICEMLLAAGANVQGDPQHSWSSAGDSLHEAARGGHGDIMRMLLKAGASPLRVIEHIGLESQAGEPVGESGLMTSVSSLVPDAVAVMLEWHAAQVGVGEASFELNRRGMVLFDDLEVGTDDKIWLGTHGAPPEGRGHASATALGAAIEASKVSHSESLRNNALAIVRLLEEAGAPTDEASIKLISIPNEELYGDDGDDW